MAKAKGPLLSIQASGTIAKTMTFAHSRGQNIVRGTVVPHNPRTPNQLAQRLFLRVYSTAITRINAGTVGQPSGTTQTPKEYFVAARVAPQVWANVYLTKGYPNSRDSFNDDVNAYNALTPEQKTAWTTWNAALRQPFEEVFPIVEPGGDYPAPFVAFTFCSAIFRAGYLATFTPGTPPTWNNVEMSAATKEMKARTRHRKAAA